MYKNIFIAVLVAISASPTISFAGVTPEWKAKVSDLAPAKVSAPVNKMRKVLMFSLATGYQHKVIPYANAAMEAIVEKSGVAELTISTNIESFSKNNLAKYDALIINNTCPTGRERHIFRDVLINKVDQYGGQYKNLSLQARAEKAARFEQNFIDYVADGNGLMVLHGAITMLNRNNDVSKMIGGSFDYHPRFQEVTLHPVESTHPMLKAFAGKKFVYKDEPYIFNGAYDQHDFRPLLKMNVEKLELSKGKSGRQPVPGKPRYMAWIKSFEKGRVFYSAPGHSEKTYERPEMLQFYLDGLQYVLGDLKVDDSVKQY